MVIVKVRVRLKVQVIHINHKYVGKSINIGPKLFIFTENAGVFHLKLGQVRPNLVKGQSEL